MFRRSAVAAVAGIGVVLLAAAGCKVQVQDAAPAGTSAGASSAAVTGASGISRAGSLTIEPSGGFSPVYGLINKARHSINVTMYEFSDTTAEDDLGAAAKRGVQVRVILDRREKSVKVTDTSRSDVAAITAVFDADFAQHSVRPGHGSDLVWSPTDSQDQLIALINGARKSLRIYSEEMGDATVEKALIAAAKRGVDVQVVGENESGEYDTAFAKLARGGVRISYYSSSTGFYIHGKVVEADYGTSQARVFTGSENFSSTSLNQNRELGLITSSHAVMAAIASTFAADFQNGKKWS
jgi:phosphatidylserine/phosphatidylglycerophosphate/cardiolipin synthase-like enzyme